MIWHIICKELLENLLSFRFLLSLLLIICLFAATSFIFLSKYTQQTNDYWKGTNENTAAFSREAEHLYNLPFYEHKIWKKPRPLLFCAEGFEKYLPNYFEFSLFSTQLPDVRNRSNFLLPQFSDIDWVFIISFLLSFIALLFTYDSLCGEKQSGTLRLILSGAIPRYKVLLGKYFGAVFTLGLPLLTGLLVSLVVVVSYGKLYFGFGDWLRILGIVFVSFLYLSMFLLLGMLISSRMTHSANSIVVLLLIWVVLVVLLPSVGRIISGICYKSPSATELNKKINENKGQLFNEMRAGKFGKNAFEYDPNRSHSSNNPPAAARYWNTLFDSVGRIIEQHHTKMLGQAFASRNFACISPAVVYQRASEAITGAGINRCANLYQQIKRYQNELKEFIVAEDQKDTNSLHLLFAFDDAVKNWRAISDKSVDYKSVPKFQEKDLTIRESLRLAIWDISYLVLLNIVIFSATFVSFLSYDPR